MCTVVFVTIRWLTDTSGGSASSGDVTGFTSGCVPKYGTVADRSKGSDGMAVEGGGENVAEEAGGSGGRPDVIIGGVVEDRLGGAPGAPNIS